MTSSSTLSAGRVAAVARMVETFDCRYRSNDTMQDETTGREMPSYPTRFTTIGRLPHTGEQKRSHVKTIGSVAVAEPVSLLDIPVTTLTVNAGDVFECVATATENAHLLGRCFRVVEDSAASDTTARHINVIQVDPPWL